MPLSIDDSKIYYTIEIIFIIFIIYFTKLYIQNKNNNYLKYGIIFFILQFIYSIIATKYIDKKDNLKFKKYGLISYLLVNNLLILFIIFCFALFIKNNNYLFLVLSIIFAFMNYYLNAAVIGLGVEIGTSF
jgi:hypothetical protein